MANERKNFASCSRKHPRRDEPQAFERLQEEIADVMMYLVRLADVCGVDLDHALQDKLHKNALKYPAAGRE